ncbi:hypothetical protein BSKO_09692 [Bryopsis sp. KO-2023]|nr:hypothetical protein BSKO_09692 [Bryopsis sp. KO-2023]
MEKRSGVAFVVTCILVTGSCEYVKYSTPRTRHPKKLNVHIVCHSHQDPGWQKTFDQYQYGTRNDIQVANVDLILDSVTQQLMENENRTFIQGEMSFFKRWWDNQSPEKKKSVLGMVSSGQLEFVNGGWVQNDEACSHFSSILDQTTRGHKFLKDTFGYVPRIGWQIDSFGHSSTQAVLSAASGMDAIFLGRLDYKEREAMEKNKKIEFLWQPSISDGEKTKIFTGTFANGDYDSPAGFDFESGVDKNNGRVVDDKDSPEYNVNEWVDMLVKTALDFEGKGKGRDVLVLMGGRHRFENAISWYKNLDKIIHYTNQNGRVHAFYSTMSDYVDAKHASEIQWKTREGDFFPYADTPQAQWTGYFSSRSSLKGYVRAASAYLQAARQMEAWMGFGSVPGLSTDSLEEAVSLLHHHHALTGTSSQDVAADYYRLISKGLSESRRLFLTIITQLVEGMHPTGLGRGADPEKKTFDGFHPKRQEWSDSMEVDLTALEATGAFTDCIFLNASVCPVTVQASAQQASVSVVLYNSLAWPRKELVRVPISEHVSKWRIQGPNETDVEYDILDVPISTLALQKLMLETEYIQDNSGSAKSELAFSVDVPPLGYSTYTLTPLENLATGSPGSRKNEEPPRYYSSLDNGLIRVNFDKAGRLASLDNRGQGFSIPTNHNLFFYRSAHGNGQASGAHVFRPNGSFHFPPENMRCRIKDGKIVQEFVQDYADWASVVWRLWPGARHVELEWTIGPIPNVVEGIEVVSRFNTTLRTGGALYTDSNGREMLKRNLDPKKNEQVAGNYYPITEAAYIRQDSVAGQAYVDFSLITDRGQGVASLTEGSLEAMLHRRISGGDLRGVHENLSETMCGSRNLTCPGLIVRGKQYIAISTGSKGPRIRKELQQRLSNPLLPVFRKIDTKTKVARPFWSAMSDLGEFPMNTHLLTLQDRGEGRILVRLAHLFQMNEDARLSKNAVVDIRSIVGPGCTKIVETSVTGIPFSKNRTTIMWNATRAREGEIHDHQMQIPKSLFSETKKILKAPKIEVDLHPMGIRTFELICPKKEG